ncbi:MAG TPA: hypothetical protein VNJ52_04320 [Patescibacteria group bacterium]|nr:hypothetical protein [Patescibacteria group bacterium]
MLRRTLIYTAAALLFLFGMRLGTMAKAQEGRQSSASLASTILAGHSALPEGRLAPTLPASDFPDNPVAQHAYATAAKIEPLLSRLPSECGAQAKAAHASLLGCFQDRQASRCPACQREDYYAYQKSRDGKSARQIRQGILQGAWKKANLSSWKQPLTVKTAAVR